MTIREQEHRPVGRHVFDADRAQRIVATGAEPDSGAQVEIGKAVDQQQQRSESHHTGDPEQNSRDLSLFVQFVNMPLHEGGVGDGRPLASLRRFITQLENRTSS